jgi:hypothetical protein
MRAWGVAWGVGTAIAGHSRTALTSCPVSRSPHRNLPARRRTRGPGRCKGQHVQGSACAPRTCAGTGPWRVGTPPGHGTSPQHTHTHTPPRSNTPIPAPSSTHDPGQLPLYCPSPHLPPPHPHAHDLAHVMQQAHQLEPVRQACSPHALCSLQHVLQVRVLSAQASNTATAHNLTPGSIPRAMLMRPRTPRVLAHTHAHTHGCVGFT